MVVSFIYSSGPSREPLGLFVRLCTPVPIDYAVCSFHLSLSFMRRRHDNCIARTPTANTLAYPTSNVLEPYVWQYPERTIRRDIFIEVVQSLHVDLFAIQALQELVRAACPCFIPSAWLWGCIRCLCWDPAIGRPCLVGAYCPASCDLAE